MQVEVFGRPNLQRFAETWCAILAARDGLEIVPGSVKVNLKGGEQDAEERHQVAERVDAAS